MPLAILRLIYFLGPLLCLAVILLPIKSKIAWWLWALAAVIVAIHWGSYFSATAENTEKISTLWVSVWTPLLFTTAIAGLTQKRWRDFNGNPNIVRGTAVLICSLPSLLALIFLA